ncbi:MAG: type II secretion system protein [Candidatus Acidiferrales bacterium]
MRSRFGDPTVIQVEGTSNGRARKPHRGRADAGFTLLELMIVIAVILILAAMASVRYDRSIAYSKEVALRNDLSTMRQAIEQYTLDNLNPPQSLNELVSGGYLGQIPVDPVTGTKDWTTDTSGMLLTSGKGPGGIGDVHSGSDKVSPFENTPYSSW